MEQSARPPYPFWLPHVAVFFLFVLVPAPRGGAADYASVAPENRARGGSSRFATELPPPAAQCVGWRRVCHPGSRRPACGYTSEEVPAALTGDGDLALADGRRLHEPHSRYDRATGRGRRAARSARLHQVPAGRPRSAPRHKRCRRGRAARRAAGNLGRLPPARQADRIRPHHGPPRRRSRAGGDLAPRASTTWP